MKYRYAYKTKQRVKVNLLCVLKVSVECKRESIQMASCFLYSSFCCYWRVPELKSQQTTVAFGGVAGKLFSFLDLFIFELDYC